MCFQPTFGTEELPERPIEAIAAGAAKDVALMTGTTKEEALIFLVDLKEMFDRDVLEQMLDAAFGAAGKSGADALAVYAGNRPAAEPHELVAAIETDRMFTVPAVRLADAQVRHNPDVWLYRFDWRTPARGGAFGAHHFLEVPFVFDQLDNPQAAGFLGDARPQKLATATHSAWVAFASEGDPNNSALPSWPRYEAKTRPTMVFDESCRVILAPNAEEVALWEGVL
jgi:para-nitrobenzyl esterase